MYVQCKGISSDAMVKHQSNGCGATCSNSHAVAALYFFSKTVLIQGSQEWRKSQKDK